MEIVNTIGVATNIQLAQSSVELRRMLYKTWKQLIHKQYAMRNDVFLLEIHDWKLCHWYHARRHAMLTYKQ